MIQNRSEYREYIKAEAMRMEKTSNSDSIYRYNLATITNVQKIRISFKLLSTGRKKIVISIDKFLYSSKCI